MLIESAIGDAYGASFEYLGESGVKKYNNLERYEINRIHKDMKPGSYTDDTQMSIAIAELIISGKEWTKENIANKFVEVFKRDERQGYSKDFYKFLKKINSGREFLEEITGSSNSNGAAMRSVPIGIYSEVEEVKNKCKIQAEITHNTEVGVNSAIAVALMSHYFIYKSGPKSELGIWLKSQIPGKWSEPWKDMVELGRGATRKLSQEINIENLQKSINKFFSELKDTGISEEMIKKEIFRNIRKKGIGSKASECVRASITAIIRNNSMAELLKDCVNFTGDVDTVCTIALGAAAHCDEIKKDLPEFLFSELENGDYGRDYIIKLDKTLLRMKENF